MFSRMSVMATSAYVCGGAINIGGKYVDFSVLLKVVFKVVFKNREGVYMLLINFEF